METAIGDYDFEAALAALDELDRGYRETTG